MIDEAFSIPDLLSARNVLCVQPHYDDNDIGAGGTIAALRARGARITYVTVTDDLVGVVDPTWSDDEATSRLRDDQRRAAEILGVDDLRWLGFPDAGPYDAFDLRTKLIEQIRRVRPDFVLTCDPWLPYEYHRDHVACGLAVAEAVNLQAGVRRLPTTPEVDAAYEPYEVTGVAFYWTRAPNTAVDVTEHRERKHHAIDQYRAQFTEEGMTLLHALLEKKERDWAKGTAFTHGERLKVLRPAHLHCNVDAVEM